MYRLYRYFFPQEPPPVEFTSKRNISELTNTELKDNINFLQEILKSINTRIDNGEYLPDMLESFSSILSEHHTEKSQRQRNNRCRVSV